MTRPPRIVLAQLPTPLVRLERLGRKLGAEIWCKRDDLTGLELSGNKVRKLEYVAADALANGCDTLVTEGTPQSNHCRATAAVCARLGLHCELLLRPPAPDDAQGNHLLDLLFGARCRSFTRAELAADRPAIVTGVLEELRAAGRRPRWTPMGASEPLACWGYIDAAAELGSQLDAAGIRECDLVVAVSSAATYAGLVLGCHVHGLERCHVRGVVVSDDARHQRRTVGQLATEASATYGLAAALDPAALDLTDEYVGEGYAIPHAAGREALRLLARSEALILDPVYTAKACSALLDGVRSGQLGRERPVVFLHTGGAFSNFAWPEALVGGE